LRSTCGIERVESATRNNVNEDPGALGANSHEASVATEKRVIVIECGVAGYRGAQGRGQGVCIRRRKLHAVPESKGLELFGGLRKASCEMSGEIDADLLGATYARQGSDVDGTGGVEALWSGGKLDLHQLARRHLE